MIKPTGYDFSGYATKNDVKCMDGRTMKKDAFAHQDGAKVQLVWQHIHSSISNILGHGVLENRDDGVYVYGYLNGTTEGKAAKEAIAHGDIDSLSIFAQKVTQKGNNVVHGQIREVSLVYVGANDGAKIDNVSIQHSDGSLEESEDDVIVAMGIEIEHAAPMVPKKEAPTEKPVEEDDKDAPPVPVKKDGKKPSEDVAVDVEVNIDSDENKKKDKKEGSDKMKDVEHAALPKDATIEDVVNTMNEEQKNVLEFLIGEALNASSDTKGTDAKHSDMEDDDSMNHNVFDKSKAAADVSHAVNLTGDDFATLVKYAKSSGGSLKDAFIAHSGDYGIDNIELLFPDAQAVPNQPTLFSRDMGWVAKVMAAVSRTPFSRIKSIAIDVTADNARAKGYVKGAQKVEEVIVALRRVTTPVTIYKKQKLDRDDVVDIIDLDIVAWIKREMRLMLEEEIARVILIGDGRDAAAEDKVNESNVRPIVTDVDTYVVRAKLPATAEADEVIDEIIRSRKDYRGSGSPVFYAAQDIVADMMLAKDTTGRRLYTTENDVASALRVNGIVEVPILESQTWTDPADSTVYDVLGVVVNLKDYTVGADRGGQVSLFEDFDIDFNQHKWLTETRISGALTVPKSAIVVLRAQA